MAARRFYRSPRPMRESQGVIVGYRGFSPELSHPLLPGRVTGAAKGRPGSPPVCFGSPGRAILKADKRLGSPLLPLGVAREMPRYFGYLIQHFCYLTGAGAVFVRATLGASYGPLPDGGV